MTVVSDSSPITNLASIQRLAPQGELRESRRGRALSAKVGVTGMAPRGTPVVPGADRSSRLTMERPVDLGSLDFLQNSYRTLTLR